MMLQLLQNGTALYLLVAICVFGIVSKLIARNSYKRLIKETNTMAMSKNKYLRNLKQKAEDAYRVNQGIVNTQVYLEKQLFDTKVGAMTPQGWAGFSSQMTWMCLLGWRRPGVSFLLVPLRFLLHSIVWNCGYHDGGFKCDCGKWSWSDAKRQQLFVSLQVYLENVLWHRMELEKAGELSEDDARMVENEQSQPIRSNVRELRERKNARRTMEQQTAASRDRGQKKDGEDWMKELKPEEIRVLGEIIREYLG